MLLSLRVHNIPLPHDECVLCRCMCGHKMKQPAGPCWSSTFCLLTHHYWNGLTGYEVGRLTFFLSHSVFFSISNSSRLHIGLITLQKIKIKIQHHKCHTSLFGSGLFSLLTKLFRVALACSKYLVWHVSVCIKNDSVTF